MDVRFYYKTSQVGDPIMGTNRIGIAYDANYFYRVIEGTYEKIDAILTDAHQISEALQVDADGSAAGLEWHILAVTHAYDKNGVGGVPSTSAKWAGDGADRIRLDLTGPTSVKHEARWDFSGPSLPPTPLKIVIKRKT